MSCPKCGKNLAQVSASSGSGTAGGGRGSGGGRRWRSAENLSEQLALQEAKANKGEEIMGDKINDPNYPRKEWAKMEWIHRALDGSKISIHYWQNRTTGEKEGFKFRKN